MSIILRIGGLLQQAANGLRQVDKGVQQVVEIIQPGPLGSTAARWNVHNRQAAEAAVERAQQNWQQLQAKLRRNADPLAHGSASSKRQHLLMTLLGTCTALTPPASAAPPAAGALERRLLCPPSEVVSPGTAAPWAPRQLYYPDWLFGEWQVTSTFKAFAMPLGQRYVSQGTAQAAAAPAEQGGIGSTSSYKLRFYSTLPDTFENNLRVNLGLLPEDRVIADRAFNTRAITNATLGYDAVQSVDYDPRESPDRETVTFQRLAPDMRPLAPQRVELYLNSLRSEGPPDDEAPKPLYVTSELCRQVVLGVRQVDVQDYEIMHRYELVAPGKVVAQQRTAVYLEPRDALYFRAGGRAVAVYDYELVLERVETADGAGGRVACVETPKDVVQCV